MSFRIRSVLMLAVMACIVLVSNTDVYMDIYYYWYPKPVPRPNTFSLRNLALAYFGVMCAIPILVAILLREGPPGVRKFTTITEYAMERMINGSPFITVAAPKFLARVFVKLSHDGEWTLAGTGFNTEYGFLTAYHVVAEAVAVRVASLSHSLEMEAGVFRHVESLGDVAVCSAIPFLRHGRLNTVPVSEASSEMVMIHNGEIASVGPLKGMDSFGMVSYLGSTTAGFSGAPYYMGNLIYGMHLGASSVNLGYEAGYLSLLMKKEESEDYYLDKIRNGEFVQWRRSPGDPDEVEIKTRKGYYVLDRAAFEKAMSERTTVIGGGTTTFVDKFGDDIHQAAGLYEDDGPGRRARRRIDNSYNYIRNPGPGGKTAGGKMVYKPHGFAAESCVADLTAPRVDFSDSENFEWPALEISKAGPSFVEKPIPTSESLPPTPETPCPSPKTGCQQDTAVQSTTVAQKETASPATLESIVRQKVKNPGKKLIAALDQIAALQTRVIELMPSVQSAST